MGLLLGLWMPSIRLLMKGNRVKNIEKYPETTAALDAYNSLDFKNVPFNEWLECEYEPAHPSTMLEAAQSVIDDWYATGPDVNDEHFGLKIIALETAIAREEAKPKRNFDRYETPDDAHRGFREMCDGINDCKNCRFRDCDSNRDCEITWLFEETNAEEEFENGEVKRHSALHS